MSLAEAPVPVTAIVADPDRFSAEVVAALPTKDLETSAAAFTDVPVAAVPFLDLTIDLRECKDITINELVAEEAELAYANWIGELHPHHAARLLEVTAELDRRWADFV